MSLKLTIKKIFIATILVFSSRAMGDVLMYNAAYTKTWEDSLTSKKGHKLVLERNYHSRSLHHGILGVGWCFEFEKSLKFMSPRKIELHDCFSRTKIVFSKVNKDTFTDLTGLLEITQKKNQFTLKKPKAQKEVYNSSGQLIEYKSQSLEYTDSRLTGIRVQKSLFRFIQNPGMVQGLLIKASGSEAISYKLEKGNLIAVEQKKNKKEEYEYDEFHNLTQYKKNSQMRLSLKYDATKDRVLETTDFRGCRHTYSFKKLNTLRFETQRSRQCRAQAKSQTKFIYHLQTSLDGSTKVSEIQIVVGAKTLRFVFDSLKHAWHSAPSPVAENQGKDMQ